MKIHPVPAGDECQRKENGRNDGQKLHAPVLPCIQAGLVGILDLFRIFQKLGGLIHQAVGAVLDRVKIRNLFFPEISIFIFFQILRKINHFIIITSKSQKLAAQRHQLFLVIFCFTLAGFLLHRHQSMFHTVQNLIIPF